MRRSLPPLIPFSDSFGNAFLLPHGQHFTAVDVGSPAAARRMVKYVTSLGRKPQSIRLALATHLHADHTGGLHELQKLTHCTVAVHRQGRRRLEAPDERYWLHRLAAIARRPWRLRSLRQAPQRFVVGRWLGNLEMVDGWQVVYTPGHTPESVCLYEPNLQILLAGDTLVGMRGGLWVNPFSEDGEVLNMSLHTLERLPVKVVYPAHGTAVRGAQAYLRALHRTAPHRIASWVPWPV